MPEVSKDLDRVDDFSVIQLSLDRLFFVVLFDVYEHLYEVLVLLFVVLFLSKVCAAKPDGHV